MTLPEHHKEELQRVDLSYGEAHIRELLGRPEKCRGAQRFNRFNKQRVYLSAECIPMELLKRRMVLMPQEIGLFDSLQDGQESWGVHFMVLSGTRFEHGYEHIISVENLLEAWKEFVRGKRTKPDVLNFQSRLMDNVLALHEEMKTKTYHHGSYRAFNISDPKPRSIHKASIRDRLLHHAMYRILYPFFDRQFIADSYSCRIGKGTHRALNRFNQFARKVSLNNTRTCWVLKCDIKKFFASINQTILIEIVKKHVSNPDTIWLMERVVESFESTGPGKGLPLGNLTSQLLVNVYMNEFDQFVKHGLKQKWYIRYADDFVIMHHDKSVLLDVLPKMREFLEEKLALSLHLDKTFFKTASSGIDFLGWVHFPGHRVLRTTTKRRMCKRIKGTETKKETVQSYLGLLRHGNTEKLKQEVAVLASR